MTWLGGSSEKCSDGSWGTRAAEMSKEASQMWLVNVWNTAVYIRQPCFFPMWAFPNGCLGFLQAWQLASKEYFKKTWHYLTAEPILQGGRSKQTKLISLWPNSEIK